MSQIFEGMVKKKAFELWLVKNKSSAYWISILVDMKAHDLQDLLITSKWLHRNHQKCISTDHYPDLYGSSDSKYSYTIKSCRDNWEGLIAFAKFPLEIR
ncbi:hypothetical protein L3073_00385 [Ancylomarina sp. DW003]|nr:hypothetical protein [Ancylomarina sp. DW003]MDE5420654.1 hypothetical protein [Ancylomarina sp. DW003]